MRFLKTTLPLLLAFVMAVVGLASYFVPHHYSDNFRQEVTVWSRVISGVTIFIGIYSLLRVHYGRIKRQQKGWGYSGMLFVAFGLMVVFGTLNWGPLPTESATVLALSAEQAQAKEAALAAEPAATQPDTARMLRPLLDADRAPLLGAGGNPLYIIVPRQAKGTCQLKDDDKKAVSMRALRTAAQAAAKAAPTSQPAARSRGGSNSIKPLYVTLASGVVTDTPPSGPLGPMKGKTSADEGVKWMYNALTAPAGATTYSLLGFFICSAAYRTFRAKTFEAALLLIAALIVMFGQVPLSERLWHDFPTVSNWLLSWPNMAVKRAVALGVCVGSVATSLRVMFGIERSYMGGS